MRTKKSFKYQFQEVWQSIGMLYLVQIWNASTGIADCEQDWWKNM